MEAHDTSALTVVSGPAGSGKSHHARALIADADATTVWIKARPHRHAVEVAGQLVRRLLDRLGEVPPDLLAAVGTSCGPTIHADPLGRAEQLGALVAGSLDETLDRDLLVVIDDADVYHEPNGPSRFVESLIRNRPARLHLVLCTRRGLRFSVQRLREAGGVADITADDLALTDAQAHRLIEDREALLSAASTVEPATVPSLTGDERAMIVHGAGGHPGAIVALTALATGLDTDERTSILQRAASRNQWAGEIVQAITATTIDRLPTSTRNTLDDVVILGGASPAVLARLGHAEVSNDMSRLVATGLVDRPADPNGRYQPSRIARDLVASRTERLAVRATAAGRVAIEQGDPRRALTAAGHGSPADLSHVLREFGASVLERGEPQLVIDSVALLDADRQAEFRGLVGRAHQALGDWSRALECFQAAGTNGVEAAIAWRHGLIHYLQGDVEAARTTYAWALARHGPDADADADADVAMLLGYACAAAWLVGELVEARELSRRSLALATTLGSDAALAVAHTGAAMVAASDNDRVGNEWHYGRALQHAERAGDTLQVARIRSNRGSRQMEEGEFAGALVELDRAVRAADLGSFGTFLALALSNRGEVLTKIGRLDDARTDLTSSINLLQGQGSRMVGYPLVGLARLHLLRGDIEQALGACERAQASAIGSSDRQFDIAVRTQLARAMAERDLEAGWCEVNAATENASGSLDEPELWTVVADLAIRRGDDEQAADAARRASELARTRHDRYALGAAIEASALAATDEATRRDLLDEAHSIFHDIGCVLDAARVDLRRAAFDPPDRGAARAEAAAALARRLGARPLLRDAEAFLRRHDAEPEPNLAVTVLGSLTIRRDGNEVAPTAWQSKKARDLFKMLLVRGGRPVPRELAIDRLWPGDDPGKVSNRLSAALATIRSVLDPDKHFDPDHFVRADSEAISLAVDDIDIDVVRFLDAARLALDGHGGGDAMATSMLVAAEAMYAGDVLEDDPYDDWHVPLREEARAMYLSVVQVLARRRIDEDDHDGAIRFLLRALEREPYDEPAHLDLISQLSRAGRHGDARRRHQYYVDRMRELDLEPRPFPS